MQVATIIAAATALAVSSASLAVALAGPPQRPAAGTTFRALDPARLAALEIATGEPEGKAPRRRPIGDLAVLLSPAIEAVPVGAALAVANVERLERGRGRALMTLDLVLVSDGRLVIEGRLRCSAWVADASFCRTQCGEGSGLLLSRRRSENGVELRLLVGELAPGDRAGGVRLGACIEREDEIEEWLAPKAGGRMVELGLQRQ